MGMARKEDKASSPATACAQSGYMYPLYVILFHWAMLPEILAVL